MATVTVDTTQSYIGFSQYEPFAFQVGFYADTPVTAWNASGLPSGVAIDTPTPFAATGAASTDIITATGHDFVNGMEVFFSAITGGAGLVVSTVYFVIGVSGATFQLAATLGGAAINFTTDISAGTIMKKSSGLVSGSVSVPGTYVIGLRPANASGIAAITYFTIGIDTADGSGTVAGSADVGVDLYFDVGTKRVATTLTTQVPTAEEESKELIVLVSGDVALLNIRATKNGVILDPSPTSLKISLKDDDTDEPVEIAGGAVTVAFSKVGSGTSAVFKLPVPLTDDKLKGALSDYENSDLTQFLAKAQIEMKQTVSLPGCSELVTTSKAFRVLIQREFN